ncbi:DUF1572 family protein [Telluribacter humicola]|uniref:DUF1572 family protein n=1 Tax=Telluribacter humicola TaxID=1720261 RepID=UPI001A97468D|nr:DUF1572 family protein [Telluribacter humicola]
METNYLDSVKKLFLYYKTTGEKAMAQVPDQGLHWQYNGESNSIAVIVKHLWGNMLSRWTDFLTSDGEKDWRDRDGEFEVNQLNRDELLQMWNEAWQCVQAALDSLQPEDLTRIIYIRNEGHTVLEAINRSLTHYAYHIGQIVYIAKQLTDADWQSLTIPRNQSRSFNQEKSEQSRERKHFTDNL